MTDKQKIDLFRRLLERVFTTVKERIEDQVDFNDKYQKLFREEYEKLRKIVVSAKETPLLKELMKTYLDRYWTHRDNRNNVRFYKSDQLFQFLIEQSAKVPDPSLFETWATYLKDTSILVSFNDRFTALAPYFQGEIEAFIARERERRRLQRSLIDLLRDEYARTHDGRQPSAAELYAFDPRPSFKRLLEIRIGRVNTRWHDALEKPTKDSLDRFATELAGFSDYLKALGDEDLLRLFQAFRQVQDPVDAMEHRRRVLYYGLHAIACIQLHSAALRKHAYMKNLDGLAPDDVEYFVGPVRKTLFLYRSNIIQALTGSLRQPAVAIGQITLFLNTYLSVEALYPGKLSLLRLDETLRIQQKWADLKQMGEQIALASRRKDLAALTRILDDPRNASALTSVREMESRTLELTSGQVLGTRVLKAGSRVRGHPTLGTIAVASIEPGELIYVEVGPFKPMMFEASHIFVADRQFAEKILEIHASTIGIVHLTQLIFIAMGFIPALVSGGIVGLIYEVATFFAGNWLQDQVAKLDPTLGVALGFALGLFGPRPPAHRKLKTDMIESPADRTGLSGALNFKPKEIGAEARNAEGAVAAADARAAAVANPLAAPRPGAVAEPSKLGKPQPEPPANAPAAAAKPAAPSAEESLVLRRMGAEARLRTARPANEDVPPDISLPQAVAKNEEAMVRLGTGTHGRIMATPDAPAGGPVTYQPSATRAPTPPDTRFAKQQEWLTGKLSSTTSGGAVRAATGGGRATPPRGKFDDKPISLWPREDGLTTRMRDFVTKAATIFREELALQPKTLEIWTRSTHAHKKTLDRLRDEFSDVTEHGQPFTGVTGPGTKQNPNVRISDATYVDVNSAARQQTPADLHIELKYKAYVEKNGKVLRVSGEKDPNVTSEQIQAYEVAQTALGVPTFVINARGEIFALEGGRWSKVGGPPARQP